VPPYYRSYQQSLATRDSRYVVALRGKLVTKSQSDDNKYCWLEIVALDAVLVRTLLVKFILEVVLAPERDEGVYLVS
jgi:hypothetical protein